MTNKQKLKIEYDKRFGDRLAKHIPSEEIWAFFEPYLSQQVNVEVQSPLKITLDDETRKELLDQLKDIVIKPVDVEATVKLANEINASQQEDREVSAKQYFLSNKNHRVLSKGLNTEDTLEMGRAVLRDFEKEWRKVEKGVANEDGTWFDVRGIEVIWAIDELFAKYLNPTVNEDKEKDK